MLRHHLTQVDCGSCSIGYPCKDLSGKTKSIELLNIRVSVRGAFLHSISLSTSTLQTKSSRSAWQVKSMERRKRASFCTTDMQRSWDSVKGRGSTSGASLVVGDSVSSVERGHSAVRRRRIRSLKCCKERTLWH